MKKSIKIIVQTINMALLYKSKTSHNNIYFKTRDTKIK